MKLFHFSRWYETWPPVASDITGDSVRTVVSPMIFNFMVWVLGFSDEPSLDSFLEVSEKEAENVFSICQDLVNFSSRGQVQMPKFLSRAIAIRQISGCTSLPLIGITPYAFGAKRTPTFDGDALDRTLMDTRLKNNEFASAQTRSDVCFGEDFL